MINLRTLSFSLLFSLLLSTTLSFAEVTCPYDNGITCRAAVDVEYNLDYSRYVTPCLSWAWTDTCNIQCTQSGNPGNSNYKLYPHMTIKVEERYASGDLYRTSSYSFWRLESQSGSVDSLGLESGPCNACQEEVDTICGEARVTWIDEQHCVYTCDICETGRLKFEKENQCNAITVNQSCDYACTGCEDIVEEARTECPNGYDMSANCDYVCSDSCSAAEERCKRSVQVEGGDCFTFSCTSGPDGMPQLIQCYSIPCPADKTCEEEMASAGSECEFGYNMDYSNCSYECQCTLSVIAARATEECGRNWIANQEGCSYICAEDLSSCTNGIKDPGEEGTDCGGACPPCQCYNNKLDIGEQGTDCGGICPECPASNCSNGLKDPLETGIDCGGDCAPCSCFNGVRDPSEDGTDCGGICPAACGTGDCSNGVQDPDEAGVDCGGPCTPCGCFNGKKDPAEEGVDCGGVCPPCGSTHCNNGIPDGDETGVDCGGSCAPCSCYNGVKDPSEEYTDCGGVCPPCNTGSCTNGQLDDGEEAVDCGGSCPPCTCFNGVLDPSEEAKDCGGPCPACGSNDDTDTLCSNGQLDDGEEGVDCGGSCPPCICKNGQLDDGETEVDCGGVCPPCSTGDGDDSGLDQGELTEGIKDAVGDGELDEYDVASLCPEDDPNCESLGESEELTPGSVKDIEYDSSVSIIPSGSRLDQLIQIFSVLLTPKTATIPPIVYEFEIMDKPVNIILDVQIIQDNIVWLRRAIILSAYITAAYIILHRG